MQFPVMVFIHVVGRRQRRRFPPLTAFMEKVIIPIPVVIHIGIGVVIVVIVSPMTIRRQGSSSTITGKHPGIIINSPNPMIGIKNRLTIRLMIFSLHIKALLIVRDRHLLHNQVVLDFLHTGHLPGDTAGPILCRLRIDETAQLNNALEGFNRNIK